MKTRPIIFFLSSLLCLSVHAQQNNNWYFGRKAGLSFNNIPGQPNPSVLGNSAMMADEAAASISDETGNLMFYTNGVTVYNKNHLVMVNGDNLDGNKSSVQIAIVPMPGNDSLYYIFTTGSIETNFASGYKYSVVNMRLDNGNGEVISKNTVLWSSCTERMATARHANGINVWLITNDNNSDIFRAWLITCNGIQPAVVTVTGQVLDQHISMNAGVIKVSPDGKLLAQTNFPFFDETLHIPNFFQLFDFDNATGIISNARSVAFDNAQFTHCEFSPDSKLLYLTRPYDEKLDQVDLTLPNATDIAASRTGFPARFGYFDIELAADEKIYLSQQSSALAVINQPNVRGSGCNFQTDAIPLAPGSPFLGLPSHINDIVAADVPVNGFTYTILDSCSGSVQFNGFTTMNGTVTWAWDFGDGNTSAIQNPVHLFNPSSLSYVVRLKVTSTLTCGTVLKTRVIKPSGIVISDVDFNFLKRCDSGYIRFTNTSGSLLQPGLQFTWDFGDGNTSTALHPVHSYTTPGFYNVKLKMTTGTPCLDDSVTHNVDFSSFTISSIPDQVIKVGEPVQLVTSGPPAQYKWSPGIWLSDSTAKSPVALPLDTILYKVTATNDEGCRSEDSVKIIVIQYDDIYVPNAFTPNNDGKNDLVRPFYPGTTVLKEFSIFNRWGQRVFTSSRRSEGWNGRISGTLQDTGMYVWIVRAEDKSGKKIERKGTFVLIR